MQDNAGAMFEHYMTLNQCGGPGRGASLLRFECADVRVAEGSGRGLPERGRLSIRGGFHTARSLNV